MHKVFSWSIHVASSNKRASMNEHNALIYFPIETVKQAAI